MSAFDDLQEHWADPPAIYRGAPFWSWNSELDPDRLCRQIESMHGAGLGGFFMHSRYGLKTAYLSDEWFECVGACVEKARELNMKAFLYDEDRWPSGPAGGIVTRAHPEFRLHYLCAKIKGEPPVEGDFVAVFDVQTEDGGLRHYCAVSRPDEAEHQVLAFELLTQPPSGWTNDGGYLDTMNPRAVAEYIRVTHEEYAARYGDDFGGVIPGIFTDEPHYGAHDNGVVGDEYRLPWTERLPEEFRSRFGYDIMEHLPELVFDPADGGFSRVRHDYRRLATELFVEAFSEQIGRWCGQRRLALTGHVLMENTLASQVRAVGACMPHYEHMQWPGIDILTDQARELATAKQCSSVANQLGAERVLSELYGCTGWDWPLEGHKFVGDWQYAAGVNFRCPHLSHYSLAGGAKRDYPASILDHSPWWKYYNVVEDYFGRLSLMLTQGEMVADVLVVHPVESAWGLPLPPEREGGGPVEELQKPLDRLIFGLTGHHIGWDFGDEGIMERHASTADGELVVGGMSYGLVIVPPSHTLRSSTVALLREFIEAGGDVLFIGETPSRVDGRESGDVAALVGMSDTVSDSGEEFLAAVEAILPRRVSVREDGAELTCVWHMLRETEDGQILFLQSHDREGTHSVMVSVAGVGPVVLWDAVTGERYRLDASEADGVISFELALGPTGSALVTLGMEVPEAGGPPEAPQVSATEEIAGPYEIEPAEDNTLPLDYCRYRRAGGEWSEPVPVLRADQLIRAEYGLDKRMGTQHQPWYLYAMGTVDTTPRDRWELRWNFHVSELPARCLLAVEGPEDFEITVNGAPAPAADGWWVDEDIRTLDVCALLREGDNEVVFSFDYRPDMEIEDLYLVGSFGVATLDGGAPAPGNMTLVAPPERLEVGSWVGQGLDHYGGAVLYRIEVTKPQGGRRCRLVMPEVACTCAAVHVGGETFVLPWAPFAADITDALTEGENEVVVEVIGGRRNILGQLHTEWGSGTGPHSFDPDNGSWTFEYQLTDHGVMKPFVIEVLEQ
ncbi:MAG: hypothetical protein J7M38_09005 [Armatimonadetes bacterium]|nr:hypothetical protein [Armatimonadota bacterium]